MSQVNAGLAIQGTPGPPAKACRTATSAALPAYTYTNGVLTITAVGALASIGSVALRVGDEFLVKDEVGGNAKYNGVWKVKTLGDSLSRPSFTRSTKFVIQNGAPAIIGRGDFAGKTYFVETDDPIVVNTTAVTFTETSSSSGGGLSTVSHDDTLSGSGTPGNPMGVVYGLGANTALEGNSDALYVHIDGSETVNGQKTFANGIIVPAGRTIVAPSIGPTSSHQHTIPDVAADTFLLQNAAGLLKNKTAGSDLLGGGYEAKNWSDPTQTQSLATKGYVDGKVQGIQQKSEVDVATTTTLPSYTVVGGGSQLQGTALAALPNQDGIVPTVGKTILVKNEVGGNAKYNGIYSIDVVGATGTAAYVLTRLSPLIVSANASGTFTFVSGGTVNGSNGWLCGSSTGTVIVGTDDIVFTQFSGAGQITPGLALSKTGNQLDVVVGASSSTVCVGNDARLSDQRTPTDGSVTNVKLAAGAVSTSSPVSGDGTSGSPVTIANAAIADAKLTVSYIKADGSRAFSGDQSFGTHKATNLANPTAGSQDAATAFYVDAGVASVTTTSIGAVPTSRTLQGTSPIAIAGDYSAHDLSANRVITFAIASEAQGDLVYRGASGWVRRAAGTAGYILTTNGASADPAWASFASLMAFGSDAQGDIAYRGASNYTNLAAGTAEMSLITGGASANPSWNYPIKVGRTGGNTTIQSGVVYSGVTSQSTSYVVAAGDRYVLFSGNSAAVSATLPSASSNTGRMIGICDEGNQASRYNISVTASSGNVGAAATFYITTDGTGIEFVSDGTKWVPFGSFGVEGAIQDITQIPGTTCLVEFRADTGVTLVSSAVSAWAPRTFATGFGNSATQSTSGKRPTVNSSWSGGLPSITFTAANSTYLQTTSWTGSAVTNPYTALVVCSTNISTANYVYDGIGSSNRFALELNGNGDGQPLVFAGAGLGGSSLGTVAHGSEKHVFCIVYAAGGSSVTRFYADDLLNAAGASGTQVPQGVTFGSHSGANSNFLDGDIGHFILFSGALSQGQIRQGTNILRKQWNI